MLEIDRRSSHDKPDAYYVEYSTDALWQKGLQLADGEPSAVDPAWIFETRGFATERAARRFMAKETSSARLTRSVNVTATTIHDEGFSWVEWEWDEEIIEDWQ